MHETSRDLGENRVGVALERETQIAADLQQVLDVLRNQSEDRGEQLVEKLRKAEQRLAELREQVGRAPRTNPARAEQQGAGRRSQPTASTQPAASRAARETEQLARELDRLQADAAGRSTAERRQSTQQSAAGRQSKCGEAGQPSPATRSKQAEKDLEEAARQLAQRRQEAELDLALRIRPPLPGRAAGNDHPAADRSSTTL